MTRIRRPDRWGWTIAGLLLASVCRADPPGLPNYHAVAPGITRGAAPTPAGLKALKALGVQTIVDLRISPPLVRREAAEARALGFRFINLPMGSDPPTAKQVATFLGNIEGRAGAPRLRPLPARGGPDRLHGRHLPRDTGRLGFPQTWVEMRRYGFNPRWSRLTDAVRRRAP